MGFDRPLPKEVENSKSPPVPPQPLPRMDIACHTWVTGVTVTIVVVVLLLRVVDAAAVVLTIALHTHTHTHTATASTRNTPSLGILPPMDVRFIAYNKNPDNNTHTSLPLSWLRIPLHSWMYGLQPTTSTPTKASRTRGVGYGMQGYPDLSPAKASMDQARS